MDKLVENIISLRKSKGFSQHKMASEFGIKRTALSAYEQGKAHPPLKILRQYAHYFNIDINILVEGNISNSDRLIDHTKVLAITVDTDNNENIELVPVKAYAGYAVGYADPEYIRELPKFRLPFLSGGTYRAFEIHGDSMLPIASGSVIVGQYIEKFTYVKPGDTYIFVTKNDGILFKRVAFIDKLNIGLKSDNPNFHSYTIPVTEINEVWKTKLYMSYSFPDPSRSLERIERSLAGIQKEVQGLMA